MKKFIIAFSLLVLCTVTSCGNNSNQATSNNETNSTESETQQSSNKDLKDADFIVNLGKGLEARWKLNENYDESEMSLSELQKVSKEYVDAEKKSIGNIDNYTFEDAKLKELAEQYCKGLDLQTEGVQYRGTENYTDLEKTWNLGYSYRTIAMHDIYMEYGLTVNSESQGRLDDFIAEYPTEKKTITIQDFINELSENIEYAIDEENSNDYSTYFKTVIENTTEYDISSIDIHVDFLDASGVVIYQSSDYISNFQAGSKVQSQVEFQNSKGTYDSMKITLDYYVE